MKNRTVAIIAAWLLVMLRAQASDPDADLLLASEKGDLKAAKQLLAQGAKVDARNATNGWTPLIFAAKRGDLEMATALVSAGADVNAQSTTRMGTRVLGFATGSGNLKLMQLLLDHGARIDDPARDGSTALHYAARGQNTDAAKLLLGKGADPNRLTYRNSQGNLFTPFLSAILEGDTNMAAILLQHGANIETRNNRGGTALMEAAKKEDSTALRWLIARGAGVNARGHHGHTAFIYAAYNGRSENLKLLLQAGADPLASASDSEEPDVGREYDAASLARQQGHDEALAIVLDAQSRIKPKP